MSRRLGILLQAAFCLLLSACAHAPADGRQGGTAAAPSQDAAESQKIEAAAIASMIAKTKGDYRIQPSDLIEITVYQDPDLTRKVRVSQNGTVFMPLIGAIKIGGMTLLEAGDLLAGKLKRYLVSPQVSLFITEHGNQQIYVLGQVVKPGSYAIPAESHLTALEAISIAGGFTPIAGIDNARVLRNVDGKSEVIKLEVTAITKLGQKEKDIQLQPNDVVFVPQSFF
jgi:polysaccharide biosynthesis/export protein